VEDREHSPFEVMLEPGGAGLSRDDAILLLELLAERMAAPRPS
jgi:hypothetical protein